MAEKSLDESGWRLTERESLVHRHRQEVKKVRSEIAEERTMRERQVDNIEIVIFFFFRL